MSEPHGKTCNNRQRHIELHQALDELLACYISQVQHPFDKRDRTSIYDSIYDLLRWSKMQTEKQ